MTDNDVLISREKAWGDDDQWNISTQTVSSLTRHEYDDLLIRLRQDISQSFANDIDRLIMSNLDRRLGDTDASMHGQTN